MLVTKEKDIVLKIALDLGKKLENNGNEVIYTRDKDIFLTLRQRAKIANDVDADLFISIHCNAFHDSSVHGSETFVYGLHVSDANFNVAKKENEIIFLDDHYQDDQETYSPTSTESLIGTTLMQEEYLDQNGGYYLPINDNLDLTLLGDYYTNGSYGFRVENTYLYRYKFTYILKL